MEEEIEKLIKNQSIKLRIMHRLNELSEMECEDFVRGLLRQAEIIKQQNNKAINKH